MITKEEEDEEEEEEEKQNKTKKKHDRLTGKPITSPLQK